MTDPRADRLARLIVERMLRVEDGQALVIRGPASSAGLFRAVTRRAVATGAHVLALGFPEGVRRLRLDAASPATLEREDRLWHLLLREADLLLGIDGGDHDLDGVEPARSTAAAQGARPALEAQMRRAAAGELRWALALDPNPDAASRAGLELPAFADLVYRAARCEVEDPVAAWAAVAERQDRLAARLAHGRSLRFLGPGTDLELRIDGRHWRSSTALRNVPDGEVFTGPHEDSASGVVTFSYPARYGGLEATGIRLRFAGGRVIEASAQDGQEALDAVLGADAGARALGEVGIGTNYRLTRFAAHTLLDEKIGGTFHLALGRGYPETGSTNVSAVHWDIVCDLRQGGEMQLDGVTMQRDGRFVGEFALGLEDL